MKHLLVISVVLFFIASTWAILRVGKKRHLSISLHVAQTRRTSVIFGLLSALAALFAAITIFGWLLPAYDAGIAEYLMYGFITLNFFTIAFVPHIDGTWRGTVHNFAAWGMVYVIPAAMISALFWPLSDLARCSTVILTAVNVILLALALLRRERYRPVFLYFQSAYLAVFFLFLLAITYL